MDYPHLALLEFDILIRKDGVHRFEGVFKE
jgi:hypothetical protein